MLFRRSLYAVSNFVAGDDNLTFQDLFDFNNTFEAPADYSLLPAESSVSVPH